MLQVNDSSGQLNKFYFVDQTWRILNCLNLPAFNHYSIVLLHQRLLAIHGTTDEERHVYKTYIGTFPYTFSFCITAMISIDISQTSGGFINYPVGEYYNLSNMKFIHIQLGSSLLVITYINTKLKQWGGGVFILYCHRSISPKLHGLTPYF